MLVVYSVCDKRRIAKRKSNKKSDIETLRHFERRLLMKFSISKYSIKKSIKSFSSLYALKSLTRNQLLKRETCQCGGKNMKMKCL